MVNESRVVNIGTKSSFILLIVSGGIGLILLNRNQNEEFVAHQRIPSPSKDYISLGKIRTLPENGEQVVEKNAVKNKERSESQKQGVQEDRKVETIQSFQAPPKEERPKESVQTNHQSIEPHKVTSNSDVSKRKFILLYTTFFSIKNWCLDSLGHEIFETSKCPVSNCHLDDMQTRSRNIEDYDAMFFHMRNMKGLPDQKKRRVAQRYIMFLMESPNHDHYQYSQTKGLFNWTATYRDDSDMSIPYGWIEPLDQEYPYAPKWSDYDDLYRKIPYAKEEFAKTLPQRPLEFHNLANKSSTVAWAVSNCRSVSNREAYVQELRKYIPVDKFGKCGRLNKLKGDEFEKHMESRYKFYLSLENSLCDQYVTEKVFSRMRFNILPIVYGKANYSQILPPHSYIDVHDFSSAKALAEYLLKLSNDPVEYLSYFWWKDHYKVRYKQSEIMAKMMCRLCEKLHSNLPVHHYEDLNNWWKIGGHCLNSPSYKL